MYQKHYTDEDIAELVDKCFKEAISSPDLEEIRRMTEEEIQKMKKSLKKSLDASSLDKPFDI